MSKSKKVIKQFKEVLARSQNANNGALAVGFNDDQAYINGIAPKPVKPHFALLNSNINDEEVFQFYTPLSKSEGNLTILAIDFSKPSGIPVLHYQYEENGEVCHLKFDTKSTVKDNEFIFIYAELGDFSFFYSLLYLLS